MDVVHSNNADTGNLLTRLEGFLRVAGQHAHWRYFKYSCSLPIGQDVVTISGTKRLAYDGLSSRRIRDDSNLWTTLANLRLSFSRDSSTRSAAAWFQVDVVHMAENLDAFECTAHAETPHIVAAASSVAALAVRAFAQTHFWSFGAPSYREFPTSEELAQRYAIYDPPEFIKYKGVDGEARFRVEVPVPDGGAHWRLMKGVPSCATKPPVLLIHGISHSSRIFHTDTLDVNLAGFLLNEGHEVWFLDHGLSTALRPDPQYRPSIDDVSSQVSEAVTYVFDNAKRLTGDGGILVFSHCIGAAALSMSILRGDLMRGRKSMIDALVMHAVPPWIHPSAVNLIRGYVGVAFRSHFFPDFINPIPPPDRKGFRSPGGFDHLIDRLGTSLPWTCKEYHLHSRCSKKGQFARAICNRMTLFYGYEWMHENLNAATHQAFPSLMGAANVDAYRQLYFFIHRERVTNKIGANIFVQEDKFQQYWSFPTLFLHGRQNETFNVESSRLSANQLSVIRHPPRGPQSLAAVGLKLVGDAEGRCYGHLDVLLGKRAYEDCFIAVGEFFRSTTSQPIKEKPKSETLAPTRIATGPIISRPRRRGDARVLRIWSETNEFQTSPTVAVEYRMSDVSESSLKLLKWFRSGEDGDPQVTDDAAASANPLRNSIFWLGDFEVSARQSQIMPAVVNGGGKLEAFLGTFAPNAVASAVPRNAALIAPPHAPDQSIDAHSSSNAIDWSRLPWFERFMSDRAPDNVCFVLGSCWYPGSWFDQQQSDRIFAKIQDLVVNEPGIDHLLLVGDQIYADASYGIFDIAEDRERFQESYRHAFRGGWASWVMSHVPTYFAIDDHEFRDNYPTARPGDDLQKLHELGAEAIQEAWNFQVHDGAAAPVVEISTIIVFGTTLRAADSNSLYSILEVSATRVSRDYAAF